MRNSKKNHHFEGNIMIKKILFSLCLTISLLSYGSSISVQCKTLHVITPTVTLKSSKPAIFLLNNRLSNQVFLTTINHKGASAGYDTSIDSSHWSAIQIAGKPVTFQCVESSIGHEHVIPCQAAVTVCQWQKVVFPKGMNGNFWVVENQTMTSLMKTTASRGYQLK
jgi:hypothetical protein